MRALVGGDRVAPRAAPFHVDWRGDPGGGVHAVQRTGDHAERWHRRQPRRRGRRELPVSPPLRRPRSTRHRPNAMISPWTRSAVLSSRQNSLARGRTLLAASDKSVVVRRGRVAAGRQERPRARSMQCTSAWQSESKDRFGDLNEDLPEHKTAAGVPGGHDRA